MKFAEVRLSCQLLLEQGHVDRAIMLLERTLPTIRTEDEWKQALELVERIPEPQRFESVETASVYARLLVKNLRFEDILEFGTQVVVRHGMAQSAPIQLECAGALIDTHRYLETRQVLENILPYLDGNLLGTAFSRLGLALFNIGEPWQEAFQRARTLLSGEELGRALLNEGYCFAESRRSVEARHVWLEALPLFKSNPRMLAWLRYNLGISALRDLDPEAERHFLEADRLTHKPQASALRAATLNGLGGARRAVGEWSRAEHAYREGLLAARDTHDRKESYLGLVRTLRLAGRHVEALETLELAFQDQSLELGALRVAQAMALLALNQPDRARESLGRVGTLVSESDRWLERIARAELARQDGRLDDAVQVLDGLPLTTLHAREEAGAFPLLFQLLQSAGRPVPEPLQYAKGTTVRVTALGMLHVTVNNRAVPIAPTGRVGELLVFLLEQGGEASLEVIGDAFYAGPTGRLEPKRVRQAVWKLVNGLRDALGWAGSVLSLRGAYQLDPNATWDYDMREVRERGGGVSGEFLKGVYTDWALEVNRELERLGAGQGLPDHLN